MPDFENREGELFRKDEKEQPITSYGELDIESGNLISSPPLAGGKFELEKIDKVKVHKDFFSSILKPALILTAITLVVALLLGFANAVTKDKIAELAEKAQSDAMKAVLPAATEYKESADTGTVKIFEGSAAGEVVGYAAKASPIGFGGAIDLVVGVDTSGNILGLKIISMSETPGIGTKITDPAFYGQFGSGEVDTISGATISSSAVIRGANEAVAAVKELLGIGGDGNGQ